VLRTQRSPDSFECVDDFLFAVFTLFWPGLGGSFDTSLPSILANLERQLLPFPTRAAARNELQQVCSSMAFLQARRFPTAHDFDKSITRFLELVLRSTVRAELKRAMKFECHAHLPPHLHASFEFARLHAYPLDSVLLHWVQLDSLGKHHFKEDLVFVAAAPPPASSSPGGRSALLGATASSAHGPVRQGKRYGWGHISHSPGFLGQRG
jgi:hypothetical protein